MSNPGRWALGLGVAALLVGTAVAIYLLQDDGAIFGSPCRGTHELRSWNPNDNVHGDADRRRRDIAFQIEVCETLEGETAARVRADLGPPSGSPEPGDEWTYVAGPCRGDKRCFFPEETVFLQISFNSAGRVASIDAYST